MNKDEESILLYFETCIVDYHGKVVGNRMNDVDFEIAKKWKEEAIIDFGRIPFDEIKKQVRGSGYTNWVRFTDKAWKLAHKSRREKAERHIETIKEKEDE